MENEAKDGVKAVRVYGWRGIGKKTEDGARSGDDAEAVEDGAKAADGAEAGGMVRRREK